MREVSFRSQIFPVRTETSDGLLLGLDGHLHAGVIRCLPAPAKAGVTGSRVAAGSGARGLLDTGDKPRYDNGMHQP